MGTTRSLQDQEKREYKWNKRAGIMQISSQNTNNKNFLTTVKSNSENITVGKKKTNSRPSIHLLFSYWFTALV